MKKKKKIKTINITIIVSHSININSKFNHINKI